MLPVKRFDIKSSQSIKVIGQLLSNDNSRRIMITLSESKDGMYVNQIVNTLKIRTSLVTYHLEKIKKLGFLTIIEKTISKRTKDHKFYKIVNPFFIVILKK